MQLLPRYLLNNKIKVIVNEIGFITEYIPVHTRTLQLQRGIDNIIQFSLLNSDQKPIDIAQTVRFVAIDSDDKIFLDLPCDTVPWIDSTVRPGLYSVTIPREALRDIDPQYFSYWVKVIDYNDVETLTFTDTAFNCTAVGELKDSILQKPTPVSIATFNAISKKSEYTSAVNYIIETWYTDPVSLTAGINSNNTLHSIMVYTNEYEGEVTVEATLDPDMADPNCIWSTIHEPIVFKGDECEPVFLNVVGSYNYIRFCAHADPTDKIPKIIVRS